MYTCLAEGVISSGIMSLIPELMVTSVTKGGIQKLPQKFKIVGTYTHDHSLESS
jgi:hypothetical protein